MVLICNFGLYILLVYLVNFEYTVVVSLFHLGILLLIHLPGILLLVFIFKFSISFLMVQIYKEFARMGGGNLVKKFKQTHFILKNPPFGNILYPSKAEIL